MSSWCCIMGEKEYRLYGVVYVIFGIFFYVYFLLDKGVRGVLFGYWIYPPSPRNYFTILLIFIFTLGMVVGSVVLALFGYVLAIRGGVRVARFSRAMFVILLIYFIFLFVYPFLFGGCIGWFYCGPEV